ncbi:hypothetical protein M0G74_12670 [Microbulbifer sp. CAU 1566]|uniref:hypothetical protein n=1 Tax=Microbulbifer sp. CAU 1566 TaxID=2933269 RepID=UPI00200305DC|nr:hypothetical protein [Microbulbifer sp. CAU 1566]MCK7598128.1 hypothetical protein [Microbulbifer sp. CAU 1566]
MNLRFLCANHRQWLMTSVSRAEQAWLEWMERGAMLCEEGQYRQAIPFLGCAFELADYLLGERSPGYSVAAMRFTDSARLLMEAYHQCGESGHGNYILVVASSRLAQELVVKSHYQMTADCIRALYTTGVGVPEAWRQALDSGEGLSSSRSLPAAWRQMSTRLH